MTWNCLRKHTEKVEGCYYCNLYANDPAYKALWDWEVENKAGHWSVPGQPTVEYPPSSSVNEPGFFEKKRNFDAAYLKWEAAGKPVTPPEEKARRWSICEGCEFRDKEKNVCKFCGCPLQEVGMFVSLLTDAPAKLDMATEGCPARDKDGNPAPRWLPLV